MSAYGSGRGLSQGYGDAYNDRVQRLFERVGTLQTAVDDQKTSRIKEIENILVELERRLNEIRDNKSDKINYFDKMIKQIQIALEEESDNRQKLENELNSEINGLEKNCQRIIEEASKVETALNQERQLQDSKLIQKMNSHVETIQNEIQKSLDSTSIVNPDFEYITQEEIPKLQRDLTSEINLRRELESKILEQFLDQIQELNEMFQDEKREREMKEEEIVTTLKTISGEIEGMIGQQKGER